MGSEDIPKGTPEDRRMRAEPEPNGARAPRFRRRPSLTAAVVAAAVLLAGGGGAYLATTAGGSHDAGSGPGGKPAPLDLDAGEWASSPARGIGPVEPTPDGSGSFRTTGPLPDGPDRARVYLATGEVARADVVALARALEVPGKPELKQGSWMVGGSADGGGPSLRVSEKAPGDWSYSRHSAGGACPNAPKGADPDPMRCAIGVPPAQGAPAGDADQVPPAAEAERAAQPVLKVLGLQKAKLDSGQTLGSVRVVAADPEVDGLSTFGWRTELSVGPEGPVTGHGPLSEPRPGNEYPAVSAERALELLEEDPAASGHGIAPCPHQQPRQPDPPARAVPPMEPAEPGGSTQPGAPEDLPCEPGWSGPLEVRTAVFGLSAQSVSGKAALVPSWLFSVARPDSDITRTVVQVAVDPKYIRRPSTERTAPPSNDVREPGRPSTTWIHLESYRAGDRTLTVRFWGGLCSEYAATAEESEDQVTVRVTGKEKRPGRLCIMIAKKFSRLVGLDRPLAGRTVVDATTGDLVPKE